MKKVSNVSWYSQSGNFHELLEITLNSGIIKIYHFVNGIRQND